MIYYLTLEEVLERHRQVLEQSGGSAGIRDLGLLESAIAQPRQTFSGINLYPTIVDKAAILGYLIVMNHPFVDGNKRTGHASMETLLGMNGMEIIAPPDEQESIILSLASGSLNREDFTQWLGSQIKPNSNLQQLLSKIRQNLQ